MNQQLLRLGLFAIVGIGIIVGFSFYVNDQPFWYRSCNSIYISVDDATGLRRKSPVKTLGLDIGYIRSVDLDSNSVIINVCITAPVRLRGDTKAYVRSIGFLGDRFLELNPVDVAGSNSAVQQPSDVKKVPLIDEQQKKEEEEDLESKLNSSQRKPILRARFTAAHLWQAISSFFIPDADAAEALAAEAQAASLVSTAEAASANAANKTTTLQASREAEISDTMKKVGKLVDQLTLLVKDLREATSQVEFKDLVINLNDAAKNLSTLLEPKGELTQNLRRSMDSLRKSLRHAEEAMERVNQGKGTIGKLLSDEKLYDEAVAAIKGLNILLGKAGNLRVYVDISAYQIKAYDGGKARFFLKIEPNPTRYYLLGISTDPRGSEERTTTQTIIGNNSSTQETIVTKENGLKITACFGKYFGPLDLKVGFIENAGAAGIGLWLDEDKRLGIMSEIYKSSKRDPIRLRMFARAQVFMGLYLAAGVDDIKPFNRQVPYFFGAGLYFNDEDIKYLLAFK